MCSELPSLLPPHVAEDCTVFTSFFAPTVAFAIVFSIISRLIGLALRPSAPVSCCHQETLDTLEAGTRAGSCDVPCEF